MEWGGIGTRAGLVRCGRAGVGRAGAEWQRQGGTVFAEVMATPSTRRQLEGTTVSLGRPPRPPTASGPEGASTHDNRRGDGDDDDDAQKNGDSDDDRDDDDDDAHEEGDSDAHTVDDDNNNAKDEATD